MVKVYLGVDYGERRLGLAQAEDIGLASAWQTLTLKRPEDALGQVVAVARSLVGLTAIAVGLPRSLDGDDTQQTKRVRDFAAKLSQELACPIVLQDEAATSSVAADRLRARGKPFAASEIDAEAAAIILQDYLDSR